MCIWTKDHTRGPQHSHSIKYEYIAKFLTKCFFVLFLDVAQVAYYHVDDVRENGSHSRGLEDKLAIRKKLAHQP